MHRSSKHIRSLNIQAGFGEAYVFPVLIGLAICIYLLLPGVKSLYENGLTMPAISIGVIGALCSLWLASQLFGNYLNLSIILVFAVIWLTCNTWIIGQINNDVASVFYDRDFLQAAIPCAYYLIHAIILTSSNFLNKDSNEQ